MLEKEIGKAHEWSDPYNLLPLLHLFQVVFGSLVAEIRCGLIVYFVILSFLRAEIKWKQTAFASYSIQIKKSFNKETNRETQIMVLLKYYFKFKIVELVCSGFSGLKDKVSCWYEHENALIFSYIHGDSTQLQRG